MQATKSPEKTTPEKGGGDRWKQRKQYENELNKRRRSIAKLEEQIAATESQLKALENKMAQLDERTDPKVLVQEYEQVQAQNQKLLKQWEEESYELEIVENEGLVE